MNLLLQKLKPWSLKRLKRYSEEVKQGVQYSLRAKINSIATKVKLIWLGGRRAYASPRSHYAAAEFLYMGKDILLSYGLYFFILLPSP